MNLRPFVRIQHAIIFAMATLISPPESSAQVLEIARKGATPEEIDELHRALKCTISSKNLRDEMALHEVLRVVDKELSDKKILVHTWIDLGKDELSALDTRVGLSTLRNNPTVEGLLKHAVKAIPKKSAILLTKPGVIEIGLIENVVGEHVFRQVVTESFRKVPLREALEQLSQSTGVSIVVDPSVKDKTKVGVSATFTNATLRASVVIIADMAGLKCAFVDNVVYVTNSAGLKRLSKKADSR